jgi:hypothetical protein
MSELVPSAEGLIRLHKNNLDIPVVSTTNYGDCSPTDVSENYTWPCVLSHNSNGVTKAQACQVFSNKPKDKFDIRSYRKKVSECHLFLKKLLIKYNCKNIQELIYDLNALKEIINNKEIEDIIFNKEILRSLENNNGYGLLLPHNVEEALNPDNNTDNDYPASLSKKTLVDELLESNFLNLPPFFGVGEEDGKISLYQSDAPLKPVQNSPLPVQQNNSVMSYVGFLQFMNPISVRGIPAFHDIPSYSGDKVLKLLVNYCAAKKKHSSGKIDPDNYIATEATILFPGSNIGHEIFLGMSLDKNGKIQSFYFNNSNQLDGIQSMFEYYLPILVAAAKEGICSVELAKRIEDLYERFRVFFTLKKSGNVNQELLKKEREKLLQSYYKIFDFVTDLEVKTQYNFPTCMRHAVEMFKTFILFCKKFLSGKKIKITRKDRFSRDGMFMNATLSPDLGRDLRRCSRVFYKGYNTCLNNHENVDFITKPSLEIERSMAEMSIDWLKKRYAKLREFVNNIPEKNSKSDAIKTINAIFTATKMYNFISWDSQKKEYYLSDNQYKLDAIQQNALIGVNKILNITNKMSERSQGGAQDLTVASLKLKCILQEIENNAYFDSAARELSKFIPKKVSYRKDTLLTVKSIISSLGLDNHIKYKNDCLIITKANPTYIQKEYIQKINLILRRVKRLKVINKNEKRSYSNIWRVSYNKVIDLHNSLNLLLYKKDYKHKKNFNTENSVTASSKQPSSNLSAYQLEKKGFVNTRPTSSTHQYRFKQNNYYKGSVASRICRNKSVTNRYDCNRQKYPQYDCNIKQNILGAKSVFPIVTDSKGFDKSSNV